MSPDLSRLLFFIADKGLKMQCRWMLDGCRLMSLCALLLLAAPSVPARAQVTGKDGVDDVKGARWRYEVFSDDNKTLIEKGLFRVNNKIMYKGGTKVGAIDAESRTETKLTIHGIPEINGTAELKKVGEKPPVWEGTLKRKNGKHYTMKVVFRDS